MLRAAPRRLVRPLVAWLARALTLSGGLACHTPTDPPLPPDAVRLTPPPVYARWWAETASCARRPGRLESVRWYVVPHASSVQVRGRQVSGYWSSASNRIVLAGDAHLNGPMVRHEMAHALTRSTRHSRALFLEQCGGVLHCGSECMREAGDGDGPEPGAIRVEPDFLQVGAALTPSDPFLPGGDGFLIMTVTARNPAAHPIVVNLRAGQRAFFYELKGAGENRLGGPAATDPAIAWFESGETKRHLFDFRIPPDAGPGAWKGEYIFRGGYGTTYVDVPVTFD